MESFRGISKGKRIVVFFGFPKKSKIWSFLSHCRLCQRKSVWSVIQHLLNDLTEKTRRHQWNLSKICKQRGSWSSFQYPQVYLKPSEFCDLITTRVSVKFLWDYSIKLLYRQPIWSGVTSIYEDKDPILFWRGTKEAISSQFCKSVLWLSLWVSFFCYLPYFHPRELTKALVKPRRQIIFMIFFRIVYVTNHF